MHFSVTDNVTGDTLDLEGDSPPSDSELENIFAQHRSSAQPRQEGFWQSLAGDAENKIEHPLDALSSGASWVMSRPTDLLQRAGIIERPTVMSDGHGGYNPYDPAEETKQALANLPDELIQPPPEGESGASEAAQRFSQRLTKGVLGIASDPGNIALALATGGLGVVDKAAAELVGKAMASGFGTHVLAKDLPESLGRLSVDATPENAADVTLNAVAAPLLLYGSAYHNEPPTIGEPDAGSIPETTEVHGDLQPPAGQVEGQVPTPEGSGGVQPQTESGVQPPDTKTGAQAPANEVKLPPIRPGDSPIKIQQPDGMIIDAVTNGKTWDIPGAEPILNVGRPVEISPGQVLWSDGPLRDGEKILPVESETKEPVTPLASEVGGQPTSTLAVPEPEVESVTPLDPASGQPIIGMGGMKYGELEGKPPGTLGEGGPGQEKYGIAQRVREERAKSGQVGPVPIGEGIAAQESVDNGRALLAKDPALAEKEVSHFEETGKFSPDTIAVARAKGEQLAFDARRTEEKFGTESPEYQKAFKDLSDWDKRTKPIQTAWHKAGMAQQGETDIDTGTFTGLARAYTDSTGKDFNPAQRESANTIVNKVKIAENEANTSRTDLYNQLELGLKDIDVPTPKNLDEARLLFSKYQEGDKFTLQQSKTIWNAAKQFYIDKGVTNFDDIRNGLATDFGLKPEQVTEALGQPKGIREITNDMWKKQQAFRRIQSQAKRWLRATAMPGYQRAIEMLPKILFTAKVGFHGTVALGTHAPMVAFQPPFWKTYVNDFGKMYKMVASPAYYEAQIQDLIRRPNYITARRAGLVNDPYTFEDFNSPDVAQWIGNISGMGNRGYAILKILRQDMFDQHWNQLPASTKIPEVAKAIADGLNHATGVVKVNAPKGANIALFAPRLEMSRAVWLVADPIKAADTFLRWKTATPSDKYFATNQLKEKAWVAGTLFGLLALNQGFLSATGSKQKINFDDPLHSDFLKFKVAGQNVSYGNAMLTMARLPVRLYQIRQSDGGRLKNLVYPDEDTYSVLGEYARSQESPLASLLTTLWFKSDWQNRPLPNSLRPVPKRLAAQGIKPYTWTEFLTEQALPIPAEEVVRDVWNHGLGMSPEQTNKMSRVMAILAVVGKALAMAGTGGRLTDDIPYGKPNQPQATLQSTK